MSLRLVAGARVLAPGQSVTVRVILDGSPAISSVPFHVLFNPEVLRFISARQGSAYSGTSLQPILIGGVNPDRPGDLAVGLSFVGTAAVLAPTAEIIVLEFEATASGESPLAFERASARDPGGAILSLDAASTSILVR